MSVPRVVVLSRNYPREGNPSAGIFINQLLRQLTSIGCAFFVVSPLPWAPKIFENYTRKRGFSQANKHTKVGGIPVLYPAYLRPPLGSYSHIVTPFSLNVWTRRDMDAIVRSFKPNLVHAFWAVPEGVWGVNLGKRFHLPVIVSLQGSDIHSLPHRNRILAHMTKNVLERADRVTSVSRALRQSSRSFGMPKNEVEVIYNGCVMETFAFDPEIRKHFRERLELSRDEVAIIYVGSLIPSKGLYELLQALQLSIQKGRKIRLILVGEGREKKRLERFATSLGIMNIISFLGQVPHLGVAKWLNAADILVLPSYNEGLPNVVLEAMACGLPVIATEVGGIPEAVEDGLSGILIPPREVIALSDAVERLIVNPELRRQMGFRGKEIVESKFLWDDTATKFNELYRSLLV